MDDCLFGFRELSGGGDARFWLDHRPSRFLAHRFTISENATRRQGGSFEGVVQVRERVVLEVRCQHYEVLYDQHHDIWQTGGGMVCGAHGEHCPAIDAVEYWLRTCHHTLVYHPRVTWDGRVWLGGLATHSGDEELAEKLE